MVSPTTTYAAATARDQLPALLRRAAAGEEIILSESRTPLARLIALPPAAEATDRVYTRAEIEANRAALRGRATEAEDGTPPSPRVILRTGTPTEIDPPRHPRLVLVD